VVELAVLSRRGPGLPAIWRVEDRRVVTAVEDRGVLALGLAASRYLRKSNQEVCSA
jgi:hypothetical protein